VVVLVLAASLAVPVFVRYRLGAPVE
jgi:hypothetical protein